MNRHKNNSKRVVWNIEKRNVSTLRGEKSQKQDLSSAKDLTIKFPERRESPTPSHYRLD